MDMLIKLYELPEVRSTAGLLDLIIRKPIGPEHRRVVDWVEKSFGPAWTSETQVALTNRPVSLFLAQQSDVLVGFACYDATARGFFGPIGVAESARHAGVGRALLLACLRDMRSLGYGYAVAGAVGAADFFRQVAGATEITDSTPGIYPRALKG